MTVITQSSTGDLQEKILVPISNDTATDDTLYSLNPDGSGLTKLFDFHNHPKHTTGHILQPRIAPDGGAIYFSSDHAYVYTPASRNLFRIAPDGSWCDQITPGPNSGLWNQPGPYGTVEGTIRRSDGTPSGNSPVFLEGMGLEYSQPDGSFRFENVPQGERWIVAYWPGSTVYDAQAISVVAGTTWHLDLVPNTDYRTSFEYPVPFGDRVYYLLGPDEIQWTDVNASVYTNVYTVPKDGCISLPTVKGFDVAASTGKLAIMDCHGDGCLKNQGLYIAGQDGNDPQLLVDMKADYNWGSVLLPQGVFWSPDGSKIAFDGSYSGNPVMVIYDAATGSYLGGIPFPATWDTTYGVHLCGWSPDGGWLLYLLETFRVAQLAERMLSKIRVAADGSLDTTSVVNLLTNPNVADATWGRLRLPSAPRRKGAGNMTSLD
jgi:hypothetical protein